MFSNNDNIDAVLYLDYSEKQQWAIIQDLLIPSLFACLSLHGLVMYFRLSFKH